MSILLYICSYILYIYTRRYRYMHHRFSDPLSLQVAGLCSHERLRLPSIAEATTLCQICHSIHTTGTQLNPLIYNGVLSGSVVDYVTSTGRTALHAALFFLSNLPTEALNRLRTSSMVAGVMQYNIFSSEQHEPCSTIVCGQPTLKGPFNPITNFQD